MAQTGYWTEGKVVNGVNVGGGQFVPGVAPTTKPVNTTMDGSTLGNTPSLSVSSVAPTVGQPTTVGAPAGTIVDANGNATVQPTGEDKIKQPTTTAEDNRSLISKLFRKNQDILDTRSAETIKAQEEENVAALRTKKINSYNEYNKATTDFNQQLQAMQNAEANTVGGVGGGYSATIRKFESEGKARLANYAILANIDQNNYQGALQNVKDKLDAQFQPVQDNIDNLVKFSQINANDLTEKEKMQLQLTIDKQKSELSGVNDTVESLHESMIQNGAPQSVYSSVDKIVADYSSGKITAQDAQSKMYQAVGVYGVDATTALQQKKLQSEIDALNNPAAAETIISDPNSTSILAQTGLSAPAFAYATQGTGALSRMTAKDRQAYINEWGNYQKKNGIDGATFLAQYQAMSKTVGANLLRNNQASVAEAELSATLDNLTSAADDASFGKLRWANVAKLFAGKEVNDPTTIKYGFHLEQLRNEFALYNAALSGQLNENGQVKDITAKDYERADAIIKDGISSGGLEGFRSALEASTGKMQTVLNQSVDAQNKQVWKLFGLGDKYRGTTNSASTSTPTISNGVDLSKF